MREAANFLNALAEGRTLTELRTSMTAEIALRRQEIDSLAREMVESGLALWENAGESSERLIVRGRSNLIDEAMPISPKSTGFACFSMIWSASATSPSS